MRQLLHKHLHPLATRHPSLMNVATATADLLRSMAIKPYTPRQRSAELALRGSYHSVHAVRCQLYKEKGLASVPRLWWAGSCRMPQRHWSSSAPYCAGTAAFITSIFPVTASARNCFAPS